MPEFIARIHASGKKTGIVVPEVIMGLLGGGTRPAVKVKAQAYDALPSGKKKW